LRTPSYAAAAAAAQTACCWVQPQGFTLCSRGVVVLEEERGSVWLALWSLLLPSLASDPFKPAGLVAAASTTASQLMHNTNADVRTCKHVSTCTLADKNAHTPTQACSHTRTHTRTCTLTATAASGESPLSREDQKDRFATNQAAVGTEKWRRKSQERSMMQRKVGIVCVYVCVDL